MNAIEHLQSVAWSHPDHYAGFSPDGDYLILTQHRESDTVTRSNWIVGLETLQDACKGLPDAPDERLAFGFMQSKGDLSPRSEGWVYVFRASHPLVGWIEYMLVRKDAPESVLQTAGEIICSLAGYPVLNDDHLGELEFEEACEYWANCSVRERIGLIDGSDVSIFAARRDEFPRDDSGWILERINAY